VDLVQLLAERTRRHRAPRLRSGLQMLAEGLTAGDMPGGERC
jgi:hypothetical protein